jgi:uncharacterized membrane protein
MNCKNCGNELKGSPRFCPVCGSLVEKAKESEETPSRRSESSKPRLVGTLLFAVVVATGLILFFFYLNPAMHSVIARQPVVTTPPLADTMFITSTPVSFREAGGDIIISLEEVLSHRLVRFEYPAKTVTRPVIAYLGTDGRVITAISVSEHCGSTDFKIKGDQIYCARCQSHWDMMTMEAYSCCQQYYPDPIPSKVVGNEVRIPRSVIESWAGRL